MEVEIKDNNASFAITANKVVYYNIALIILVTLSVYSNSISNGFVFDDNIQIIGNRWITDIKYLPEIFSTNVAGFNNEYATSYYRPLMYVIYLINFYLFGLNPIGFHFVNVLFHCLVCILVFLFAKIFFFNPSDPNNKKYVLMPLMSTILFATHPIHTEPVVWVSAIPELSFTFFYLLSFYLYIVSTENDLYLKVNLYTLSLLSFYLSTLCKEPALTLPIIIIIYDYLFRKTLFKIHKISKLYIPYIFIILIYLLLRYNAIGGIAPSVKHKLTLYQNIINIFPLFFEYIKKLFFPINLSAFYIFTPISSIFSKTGIISLLFMSLYILILAIAFKKNRRLFFCLCLLFFPILPALYIPGLSENAFADRQLYLPSLGFVFGITIILFRLKYSIPKGKNIIITLFIVLAVTYSFATFNRNKVWKDEYSLWKDVVTKTPESATAHGHYGYALYSKGLINEAIKHYLISIDINPNLLDTHLNLGTAYAVQKYHDKAIEEYRKALAINNRSIHVHLNLGLAYIEKGWIDKAIEEYNFVLRIDPYSSKAYFYLGNVYGNAGLFYEAIKYYDISLRLDPTDQSVSYNRDKAISMLGNNPSSN